MYVILGLGLNLKMNFLWKRGKWDELIEFLETTKIELWC